MGLKERAQQMATSAATVALATTGLSSCNNNGAVDPPPPPFACDRLSDMSRFLQPTANRAGDTVTVTIRNVLPDDADWLVAAVTEVSNASVLSAILPAATTPPHQQTMVLRLQLASASTPWASFLIQGQIVVRMTGMVCPYRKTYTLTISGSSIQIAAVDAVDLPLAAPDKAEIVLVRNEGRAVELQARTAYKGPHQISWRVTAGELTSATDPRVHWQLPTDPGVYQAELVVDFGLDGFAFDTLLLEVTSAGERA